MSTRSGKRIHNSFHENTVRDEPEIGIKSERKTRTKKLKENVNNSDMSIAKSKKRNNYVTYPTDEETVDAAAEAQDASEDKATRKLLRNTLKDHNIAEPLTEDPLKDGEVKKVTRLTRRTKKFAESIEDGPTEVPENHGDVVIPNGKSKTKKGKKKSKAVSNHEVDNQVAGSPPLTKKSKKKKKKGKRSSDFVEEEIVKKDIMLNKSNTSIDSYHSAAGSPLKGNQVNNDLNKNAGNNSDETQVDGQTETLNETLKKNNKRKSSLKNSTFDKIENDTTITVPNNLNTTFDKSDTEVTDRLNTTFEKETTTRKSVSEKAENANGKLNSTFEKKTRQSRSSKCESENLNATFEKTNTSTKTGSLNSTYDKESDKKLDTTFDKTEPQNKSTSAKSSLISSDNTINVTFDKSDNSRISITFDESRTENIVNTTPLLIESSLEDSRISENLSTVENMNTSQRSNKKDCITVPLPVTPLKREGTFTKDGPDVIIMSPKPKLSSEKTPTKSMSLPSPGFTPFHVTRSSQREKSVMNVTRSLEKSTRRSSLVNLAPRQTKVMFCSPTNNPGIATQQKKKIIKSSLKGSNKSFVFDESASEARPGSRKRSFSSEAAPARAKRSRLQLSVERLSRPRTSSAAAKLTDNTPKKETPVKAKSSTKTGRTKLPNFAALHQKEFSRMESLDECQERKAKRARQLLTPRARAAKGTTEKVKPAPHTNTKDTKKLETPANANVFANPTLESLRPGFTRFGFKMHVDGNPFSLVTSKTETKPKEIKPNGLTRQATLPSIKAATVRKETAKQAIMREKSFTSLSNKREVKRKEDRTIIKGVRTNRRFELQMQMRNMN